MVVLAFATSLAGCTNSDSVDRKWETILDRDPLVTTQLPGTVPWKHLSDAGGAGMGDTWPTSISVIRHLEGSRVDVAREYATLAIRSGWRVTSIDCSRSAISFSGGKQFNGFIASALVGVGSVFGASEAVSISVETPYHGDRSNSVLPSIPVEPLTVQSLASTCIGH